jgi:hypothetical protein
LLKSHHIPRKLMAGAALFAIGFAAVVIPGSSDPAPSDPKPAEAATVSTVYLPTASNNSACYAGPTGQSGIQGIWYGNVSEDIFLQCAGESGASWARVFIEWGQVEAVPGVYDYTVPDKEFGLLVKAGLKPVVNFRGAPDWATDAAHPACGPYKSNDVQNSFANFVNNAVKRYSVAPYNVKRWIFYNEPDTLPGTGDAGQGGCWGQDDASAAAFGNMLRAVYPQVKSADPNSRVIFGALAMDYYKDGPYPDPNGTHRWDWIRKVLNSQKATPGEYFDEIALNYYFYYRHLYEQNGTSMMGKAGEVRKAMSEVGKSKPLMIAEVGQIIACPGQSRPPGTNADVARTVAQQLTYGLADNARSGGDGIESVMWFSLTDNQNFECWGLTNQFGVAKPQYKAYQVWSHILGGARLTQNASEPTYGVPPTGARKCGSGEVASSIDGPFICDSLQWYKFTNDLTNSDVSVIFVDPGNITNSTSATRNVSFPDTRFVGIVDNMGVPVSFTRQNGQVSFTVSQTPVYVSFSR